MRGRPGIGGHRIGERPERRGHRGLEPAVHPNEPGQRAQQPVTAMFEQPGRAVAPRQAHGERLDARAQRGDALTGFAILLAQFGDALIGAVQCLGGVLVLGVEARLARVELVQFLLYRFEFGIGGRTALPGLGNGGRDAGDLAIHRLCPRAQRVYLAR